MKQIQAHCNLSLLKVVAITVTLLLLTVVGCMPKTTVVEVSANLADAQIANSAQVERVIAEKSCNNPANAQSCALLADQILATTVRIELRRWQQDENGNQGAYIGGSTGHATIKDGRYLVTHNHYDIPFTNVEDTAKQQIRISVYKANGEVILDNMPTSTFTVVSQNDETVVLDFGEYGGEGMFAMLGMPSADFRNWQSLSLTAGMEVAQINWDNARASVQWVNIKNIATTEGTPRIELDNGVIRGASGGGIFLDGVHIGNNWTSTTVKDALDGSLLNAFSAAALNSDL